MSGLCRWIRLLLDPQCNAMTQSATFQTGADVTVRAQFINNGHLSNTQDTNFRAVQDNWPVFGLAHDLGSVSGATTVVYTVGHVREPAIEYVVSGGTQDRSLYFWSEYPCVPGLISAFLSDYTAALSRAQTLDTKVNSDASKISTDYAGVVALSIRQAIGATEITISKNSDGTWNTSDIIVFLKEISSDGNVNTVDVIFPAWPVLLYFNPALGKYLLEGLFRYQASGLYPNKWSVHDLGSSYPKALGHNSGDDEAMPVEESGNMLIMALSYAQKTGDNSHLQKYTSLLNQWTQFLITDSLIPANQLSTDDFAGHLANQTNLAIKGIVGIKAMSEIYQILGNFAQSSNYSSIAASYVATWQTLAASSTGNHLTLDYGDSNSWGLTYNLFADKLLKLNLFPTSIYTMQSAWYKTVPQSYGVPLDTRHTYSKTDWQIWTAAIATDTTTRDLFISSVKKYASDGLTSQPFGDWYETTNGQAEGFRARPVVGGHLGLELHLKASTGRQHPSILLPYLSLYAHLTYQRGYPKEMVKLCTDKCDFSLDRRYSKDEVTYVLQFRLSFHQLAGWSGFVRVDGKSYNFLGAPHINGSTPLKATQKSFEFTATQSIFVLTAGPVDVQVTFLSPVEATDFVKQSIPLSYMAVSIHPTDGQSHSIQVYSDVTAEWTSGDDAKVVNWTTSVTADTVTHRIQQQYPSIFSEVDNHTEYGSVFYSTPNFLDNGRLPNTQDTSFRAIEDGWPVFGIAHDLGVISETSPPVVYSIGHISFFLRDYHNALSKANSLDAQIKRDAKRISTDYADLVALSIRQAIGATEITISKRTDGTWNTSDVLVFLKDLTSFIKVASDISRGGNVNTVDAIFASWPALLYLNPTLGKYLLEGILQYGASGISPHDWAVHDLGTHYPNATGHDDGNDIGMIVEETANMLIMSLSYAQRYKDYTQLKRYFSVLDRWTKSLVKHSLIPDREVSADDSFAGSLPNQTNLAVKGIIGIKAMSLIADVVGDKRKREAYSSIATKYLGCWEDLSLSLDKKHLTLNYGNPSSWGITYNLYADKLLKLSLISNSTYELQTNWYKTVALPFGVPLDSRQSYTKTDWQIWAAATVTNEETRDSLIASVKKYASAGTSDQPLGDLYDASNGIAGEFRARAVVGGHLALVSRADYSLLALLPN
ncbi:hypothetical protein H0H93_000111 [Arthromyces matolae]|nr:hypothetical protein H0H93_000111 [Arthromyces matolae]